MTGLRYAEALEPVVELGFISSLPSISCEKHHITILYNSSLSLQALSGPSPFIESVIFFYNSLQ